MDAIEPNVTALLWFGLLFALACVAFFIIVGMFPLKNRPPGTRAPGGLLLIGCNLAALLVLLGGTALYGWEELRWTSLVILSGVIFLFAPELTQNLPQRWRDGRPGLVALLVAQIAGLSVLYGAAA